MRIFSLDQMTKGWFVGDFEPTSLRTQAAEVAVKKYFSGEKEDAHIHRVATEITLILSGEVKMAEHHLVAGDIIVLKPGESTDFIALVDAVTVVVKVPSVAGDKYPIE